MDLHRNRQEIRIQSIISYNVLFTGALANATMKTMKTMMIMIIIIIIIIKYAKSNIQNLCVYVCHVTLGTAHKCNKLKRLQSKKITMFCRFNHVTGTGPKAAKQSDGGSNKMSLQTGQ